MLDRAIKALRLDWQCIDLSLSVTKICGVFHDRYIYSTFIADFNEHAINLDLNLTFFIFECLVNWQSRMFAFVLNSHTNTTFA